MDISVDISFSVNKFIPVSGAFCPLLYRPEPAFQEIVQAPKLLKVALGLLDVAQILLAELGWRWVSIW